MSFLFGNENRNMNKIWELQCWGRLLVNSFSFRWLQRPRSACQPKCVFLQIQILSRCSFISVWMLKSDLNCLLHHLSITHNNNTQTIASKLVAEMLEVIIWFVKKLRHFPVQRRISAPQLDRALIWKARWCPRFFLHPFWKPRHIRGYAHVVTKATHWDWLVMSGNTSLIWSLAINRADSLPEKI